MDPQVLLPSESLPTVLAGERALSSVDALVRLQVSRLREALPALSAAIRPLARVDAYVGLQAPRRREALPAVAADEAPVPAVPVQVQRVQSGSTEAERQGDTCRVQVWNFVQDPMGDGQHAGQALVGPRGAQIQLCVEGDRADQGHAPLLRGPRQGGGASSRPNEEPLPRLDR